MLSPMLDYREEFFNEKPTDLGKGKSSDKNRDPLKRNPGFVDDGKIDIHGFSSQKRKNIER